MNCPHCDFHNLEATSTCLRCGQLFAEAETPLDHQPVVELAEVRGHSAGFLQLNDIASASTAGRLDDDQIDALLEELLSYLEAERQRFARFEPIDNNPEYNQGTILIATGLDELACQVENALDAPERSPTSWANLLEAGLEAETKIRDGSDLLLSLTSS